MHIDYQQLSDIISFEGFIFDRFTYRNQEIGLLQPRLEALGYTEVKWGEGESDSFGPLTRTCQAKNSTGETVLFMYG